MDKVKKYRVMMNIHGDDPDKPDIEIGKIVTVSTPEEAREKARQLVRIEDPGLNYMRIYFQTTEELFD
ncbi:MAG: hypothetical protein ABSD38_29255 [Syntrophorhabdales bacterium]|jgi:hypothetical protein